jgi:DNA-binding CsgD family transcriptional regulator
VGDPLYLRPEPVSLSVREEEVLRTWIEEGSYKRVAFRLFITEGTVKTHAASIIMKFGVHNIGQAAVLWDRSQRVWPDVERRRTLDRRSGEDRRKVTDG